MSLETVNVRLGKLVSYDHKGEEQEVFMKARRFFTVGIFAKSRSGKTQIAKSVVVRAHHPIGSYLDHRRVIVFDPNGEYHKLATENDMAKYPSSVFDLKIVENFALPLHFFNTPSDWHSLGIAEMGAKVCADLASRVDLHEDSPDKFCSIVEELPSNEAELEKFNAKYEAFGFKLPRRLPENTVISLSAKTNFLKRMFKREDDDKLLLDNVQELALNHNLVFDLGLLKGEPKEKVQAYVGIILRQLSSILGRINPIIVFEEADHFCPNLTGAEQYYAPTSLYEIEQLVLKMLRMSIGLIFITQDEKLLSPVVVRNLHYRIVGKLDPDSKYYSYTEHLYWDYDRGIRQFVFIDENNRAYTFEPDKPDCAI